MGKNHRYRRYRSPTPILKPSDKPWPFLKSKMAAQAGKKLKWPRKTILIWAFSNTDCAKSTPDLATILVLFEKYVFVIVSQGLNLGFLALDFKIFAHERSLRRVFTIYFTAEFERNRGLVDKVWHDFAVWMAIHTVLLGINLAKEGTNAFWVPVCIYKLWSWLVM